MVHHISTDVQIGGRAMASKTKVPHRTGRSPEVHDLLQKFVDWYGLTQDFVDATEHAGSCRCDKCLKFWSTLGPDEDGKFGPFSGDEVEEYRTEHGD